MKRFILLPDLGEQQLVSGHHQERVDFTTGIQPSRFPTVLKGNPKATSWTGKESPYGYVDWWPHSLYVNTDGGAVERQERPLGAQLLHRPQEGRRDLPGRALQGAPSTLCRCRLPAAQAVLRRRTKPAAREVQHAASTTRKKGDALLTAKGWTKNANGMWQDEKGQPVKLELISFFDFTSVGPVVVEMLKRGGHRLHLLRAAGHLRPLLGGQLHRLPLRPRRKLPRTARPWRSTRAPRRRSPAATP